MQASSSNQAPVALITGGGQRIGAVICQTLHKQGFNIVIHYHQSQLEATQLCDSLNQLRSNSATALNAQLDDNSSLQQLITHTLSQWGRLDALINNASSFYPTPIASATAQDWDTLINSNVKGAFFLCQAASPALAEQQGCIVNIIDIHAQRPLKQHSIYCIAKAGLNMLTQSLAKELAPIRVNGIAPGAILWPEQQGKESLSNHDKENILDKIPLGRAGSPADIASAVVFLVTQAPYITGQILAIDGGRSLSM